MDDINEWFRDLDEKMNPSWRLRWFARWEKIKLDISEWWHWLRHKDE